MKLVMRPNWPSLLSLARIHAYLILSCCFINADKKVPRFLNKFASDIFQRKDFFSFFRCVPFSRVLLKQWAFGCDGGIKVEKFAGSVSRLLRSGFSWTPITIVILNIRSSAVWSFSRSITRLPSSLAIYWF